MNQLFGNNPERNIYAYGTYAFDNSWYAATTASSIASAVETKETTQPTASNLIAPHSDATTIYPDENGQYDFHNIHCGEK